MPFATSEGALLYTFSCFIFIIILLLPPQNYHETDVLFCNQPCLGIEETWKMEHTYKIFSKHFQNIEDKMEGESKEAAEWQDV